MPTRTGVSHLLSAVLVLPSSPFVQRFSEVFAAEYDLMLALDAFAQAIANSPISPTPSRQPSSSARLVSSRSSGALPITSSDAGSERTHT